MERVLGREICSQLGSTDCAARDFPSGWVTPTPFSVGTDVGIGVSIGVGVGMGICRRVDRGHGDGDPAWETVLGSRRGAGEEVHLS